MVKRVTFLVCSSMMLFPDAKIQSVKQAIYTHFKCYESQIESSVVGVGSMSLGMSLGRFYVQRRIKSKYQVFSVEDPGIQPKAVSLHQVIYYYFKKSLSISVLENEHSFAQERE